MSSDGYKVLADNRKARFQYEILEVYEAGLELTGTEVKSIRAGRLNLGDGYARVKEGQAYLLNVHISPLSQVGKFFNHEPRHDRKLLLHKKEITKLIGVTEQQGLTLVPLKVYLKSGWIKITIGLARGKKLHDKREDLKKKQDNRDMQRAMKHRDR